MQKHPISALIISGIAVTVVLGGVAMPTAETAWSGEVPSQTGGRVPSSSRSADPTSGAGGVLGWFERAAREYQDNVVDRLVIPTGRGSGASTSSGPTTMSGRAPQPAPGIVAKLRDLLSLGTQSPATTPHVKAPEAGAAADRMAREIDARTREQERNAEELRVASDARRARETVDRATLERQKLAEAARIAEEARRSARPTEVAVAAPVEPLSGPKPKPDTVATPRTVGTVPDKEAVDAAGRSARGDQNGVTPTAPSPKSMQTAQAPPAGTTETATKRAPPDLPTSPPVQDASATASKAAAARLADTAMKAATKALAKATKKPKALVTVASDEASHASRRSLGKSKRCGAAGRLVETTSIYVVKSGDTLWDISRRYYDKGSKFERIVRANSAGLADPDLIFPCQKVYLPGRHAFLWIVPGDDIDPS